MSYADPVRKKAYGLAYYQANKERFRERSRLYHEANKGRISQRRTAERMARPEKAIWRSAKERATKYGLAFDLAVSDVVVPERCPILGIPLSKGSGQCQANSPSLDRLDPSRGYVRGNVTVISHRANTIKSDATIAELAAVLRWMQDRSY